VAIALLSITLLLAFDLTLLISGLAVSWLFWCFGLTISLHKMSSHKAFEPKNKLIKYILLWFGTVITMGSAIDFSAGHRQHHKFADTDKDPYNIEGSFFHKFKLFFYWFPTSKISPLVIKDLLKDKEHVLFNNHYWKILAIYPAILLLINPVYVAYFYALPVIYVLIGMGYVTVWAHLPYMQQLGTRPYATDDNSWNSKLFVWLLAGEGYHNTHHQFPGYWNYETLPGDIDISGRIIKVLKKNEE
jgi:stearoyl-CoA desaturase (delta-9 desaturase)